MTLNVVVSHQVTIALTRAAEYYTAIAPNADLAGKLFAEVDGLLALIAEQPHIFRRVDATYRRALPEQSAVARAAAIVVNCWDGSGFSARWLGGAHRAEAARCGFGTRP